MQRQNEFWCYNTEWKCKVIYMRKVFLLAVMVLFSTVLHAQPRGEEQMTAIAAGQLQQAGRGIKVVKQSSAYSGYTGRDGGFVVVSRDESCPKVLGYSSSAVDMQNLPDGLQWWLEAVEALSEMRTDADAAPSTAGLQEEVPNFMTSTWGQSIPYNMVCPVDNIGKRSLTGCIATALGQALYYYKYPSKPVGTNAFYVYNAGPYRDDFADEYNWAEMRDSYTPNVANENALRVAELLRDCGYASAMNYSSGGSEAYCHKQALALTYNFSYPTANIRYASRKYYSNEEWMHIIYRELKARRPVLYTGLEAQEYDADGNKYFREGHSFIFSGMDADGRLYVNWGWYGMADGFFDFSDLAPAGIQNHAGTYHFNYDQEMIYGVTPESSPSPMAPKYSDFGTQKPSYSIELLNDMLLLDFGFINFYYLSFSGSVDLIYERADGLVFNSKLFDTVERGIAPIKPLNGIAMTTPERIPNLQAGTYKVYVASKATDDTQYQPLRCEGGPIYFELTKSASGSITISEAKPMDYRDYTSGISMPTMVSVSQPQSIYTLSGQQVSSAGRGISIVRQGGKVKKILNK